jgi:hypothetical protein
LKVNPSFYACQRSEANTRQQPGNLQAWAFTSHYWKSLWSKMACRAFEDSTSFCLSAEPLTRFDWEASWIYVREWLSLGTSSLFRTAHSASAMTYSSFLLIILSLLNGCDW